MFRSPWFGCLDIVGRGFSYIGLAGPWNDPLILKELSDEFPTEDMDVQPMHKEMLDAGTRTPVAAMQSLESLKGGKPARALVTEAACLVGTTGCEGNHRGGIRDKDPMVLGNPRGPQGQGREKTPSKHRLGLQVAFGSRGHLGHFSLLSVVWYQTLPGTPSIVLFTLSPCTVPPELSPAAPPSPQPLILRISPVLLSLPHHCLPPCLPLPLSCRRGVGGPRRLPIPESSERMRVFLLLQAGR